MLYQPEHDLMWDTWLVERDGVFHLFYIRVSPRASTLPPRPTIGDGWDGISLAVSSDLLHWQEVGPVLEKHPDAAWLGTGMIHRVGDWYVMNFSEERPVGHQVVCLARSRDLRHWERLPAAFDLSPDPALYQTRQEESADPLPRWDSIGVVPPAHPGASYYGFVCANAVGTQPGRCGTLGLLRSEDGLRWEQLPPAVAPGLFPSYEVPEHLAIADRHYILFCTNSTAGPRFDRRARGPHGGTYYLVSDALTGPYVLPAGDPLLIGQRDTPRPFSTYVGRHLLTAGGEHLLYHQWTARMPEAWWGPPKLLVERRPFELGLDYWPGTDGLKATLLAEGVAGAALQPVAAAGNVPVIEWSADGGSVLARDRGGAHGAAWALPAAPGSAAPTDLADGRVLNIGLRIREGRGLGIWFQYRDDPAMLGLVLNAESMAVEIGTVRFEHAGASLVFEPEAFIPWRIAQGVVQHLRVLARRNFLEVYIDNRFAHAFVSRHEINPNRIGFYAELATGDFLHPCLWAMA